MNLISKFDLICFSFFFCSDINPTGDLPNSWFHAQSYCRGQGLTIERNKSDQPYWTGLYRRLTPWINILGQYRFAFIYHKFVFNIILNFCSMFCFSFFSINITTVYLYMRNKFEPLCFVLGCYRGSFEALHKHMKKIMIRSSVGLCQEICHRKYIDKFAIQVFLIQTMQLNPVFCVKANLISTNMTKYFFSYFM